MHYYFEYQLILIIRIFKDIPFFNRTIIHLEGLIKHIESLIFVADQPISLSEIKEALELTFEIGFAEADLIEQLQTLLQKYSSDDYSMEVVEIAGGYQFLTKGAYHGTIGAFLKNRTNRRLSRSAMETLSIIAYKQPVTKSDMERIRGVSCDYAVQKLLAKDLVSIIGRSDGPGKPLLYGTSDKFMEYFGIKGMDDLPKPKEFKSPENVVGSLERLEDILVEPQESKSPNQEQLEKEVEDE